MIDTDKFKKLLEEEKGKLESQLKGIAMEDDQAVGGWQAVGAPNDGEHAERGEVADHLEELGDREAVESTLEKRLGNVDSALNRIEEGTYGKCEIGGTDHEIEEARLEANPAAKTCLEHLEEEIV